MPPIKKLVCSALLVLFFSIASLAATFTVNTTADTPDANAGDGTCADSGGLCSFRAAISEANALAGSDIINLPVAVFTQTLTAADEDNNAGGDWDIRSNITVNGGGEGFTILQSASAPNTATERVLDIVQSTNSVTINGVTVRNGSKAGAISTATIGGGIHNAGFLVLTNSTVSNNTAAAGGGVDTGANFIADNIKILNNTVKCADASVTCYGAGLGGDAQAGGSVAIANSIFSGNIAHLVSGFSGLTYGGGAGFNTANGLDITINNCGFINNRASIGGGFGINVATSPFTAHPTLSHVDNSVFTGNVAESEGGGAAVINSSPHNVEGTFNLDTFDQNSTEFYYGGGVSLHVLQGPMEFTFDSSTFSRGFSPTGGGGLAISTLNVNGSPSSLTAHILNCTISGNSGGETGGAVLTSNSQSGSVFPITNFEFCTVVNNTEGGIKDVFGNRTTLKNSIIANNDLTGSGRDLQGFFTSQDYNHILNRLAATITLMPHDVTGIDPQLEPLANNAGPTLTHMPSAASPVLNTIPNGVNGCGTPGADQRGYPRPVDGACEKGSVERPPAVGGPWNISGAVKTSDGRPIRNIEVIVSGGGLPAPVRAFTGMLGQYLVPNLPAGSYDVSVKSRRFTFPAGSQRVSLTGGNGIVNFTSNGGFGLANINLTVGPGTVSKSSGGRQPRLLR